MFNGQRIAQLRKQKGLTQQELASHLGINDKTISKYERNKIFPGPDILILLAKTFDVSLDYFFGLTDEEVPLDKSYVSSDQFLKLPDNYTPEFKKEMQYFMDVLKHKYKLK